MISLYVMSLGIFLILLGCAELCAPLAAFRLWTAWTSKKLFFLHGILLIAAGFPLTIYRGRLSVIIFIMGLIMVLMGPFVLMYPEKFRDMFRSIGNEMKDGEIRKIIYVEAGIRVTSGILMVAGHFMR
ncbi:MAG: hypothetical protein A2176_11760 [Spirochaetes bacterium RBG_13_51_14]|nr:MAG: hypothetical protein A2176_11760 [Spirochaetes bacterium RBG_13_51_14]